MFRELFRQGQLHRQKGRDQPRAHAMAARQKAQWLEGDPEDAVQRCG